MASHLDLTGLFVHAAHVLNTELAAALAKVGMTQRQHCVLAKALDADRTQIQIAELAELDKTTMVTTLDELEKAGLAERRPSPTDRRARIVAVTDLGRTKLVETTAIVDRVHADVLASLPDGDRFAKTLEALCGDRLAEPAAGVPVRRARRTS